ETLIPGLDELDQGWRAALADPAFAAELDELRRSFGGRPTPLTLTERFAPGKRLYLKREDLLHTGAHKLNNALGQALLARRLGKRRIVAETGAGQHGVATATVCARFGFECVVYMGAEDMIRQASNVERMGLLGAEVRPVEFEAVGAASLGAGRAGVLHGSRSSLLVDDDGQVLDAHSISAGLDYPGVGPEHAFLRDSGRAEYVGASDEEALASFRR